VDEAYAKRVAHQLIGDDTIPIEITSVSTWTVNNMYATRTSQGRVFCMGDAIHRHPPSNGLGSNTSIQDAFNLAWKLAFVLRGQAGSGLLESYDAERAPVAGQIVARANKSIDEFGPIFEALGLLSTRDPAEMQANVNRRLEATPEAEARRARLREAIAAKVYEFDAHGVEMNQRYRSSAAMADGQEEPPFALDPELHYQPTTWPGARVPHVWLHRGKQQVSTLDVTGKGRFCLLTGIGGEAWIRAAATVGERLGIPIAALRIGPRCELEDHLGAWARVREVRDSGAVLVRPDHHVAWRAETVAADPPAELTRVLSRILDRQLRGWSPPGVGAAA
jgi:2,4-dichlorophenol 6-monooxygenase